MPKVYPPDAVREACSLYMTGLSDEEVARHMRQNGYASYAVETIRRWAKERGWEDQRARLAAEEGAITAALDEDRLAAEILSGLVLMRSDIQQKRLNGEVEFAEAVKLQLSVEAQIRQLLAQKKNRVENVDKPALALEVLQLLIQHLGQADPHALSFVQPHIEDLGQLIKERYAEAA